jgi:hypothetical protein
MPLRFDGHSYHPLIREAAADLLCAGYSRVDTARIIGVTDGTLRVWFGPTRPRHYSPVFIHKRVLELHAEGKSYGQIGVRLGMPRSTVQGIITRNTTPASRDTRGVAAPGWVR